LLFTLLVAFCLIVATTSGVLAAPQGRAAQAATSTGAIAYQGRLADASGAPLTGTYILTFRLYNVASGGSPLWEEIWIGANNVQVTNGLFSVMLGSITPIPQSLFIGNSSLWLGVDVGTDAEMTPRVQLGSVPYAILAQTVPDGSITTAKLADGSVTLTKLDSINGRLKDVTGYVAPVGTIVMYAGATAPQGWLLADGSAVSRAAYPDLFTAVGTTFGNGDGSATFNLPDLRGRATFGKTASGTFQTLGATGGAETHSHTVTIADHAHYLPFSHSNSTLFVMWNPQGTDEHFKWSEGFQGPDQFVSAIAVYGGVQSWSGGTGQNYAALTSPGGGQTVASSADSNVPPFVVVNYIIKY
ncbi:MAG: tail fiber protein, partial [Anaerolineales bacterium]